MELITNHENSVNSEYNLLPLSQCVFHIGAKTQKSKTVDFFKDLYTYPPKFKIKWDAIDELDGDLMLSYNYNLLDHSFPFIDTLRTFFNYNARTSKVSNVTYFQNKLKVIKKTTKKFVTYYSEKYSNKQASINFYTAKTNQIQHSIQTIPVYTVVGGQQEGLVLLSSKDIKVGFDPIKTTVYNFYDGFRNTSSRSSKLGLFFMSLNDAEVYLNEIATIDVIGTKRAGLSVQCVGLDVAYRVTREYHPGIDFRFIPNLTEVRTLLNKKRGPSNSNFIFEDSQHQLRFRRRPVKIIPVSSLVSNWLTPFSSFLSNNEYFKGVPIYIVQVNKSSNTLVVESLLKTANILDNLYGKFLNSVDSVFGFGQNGIIQGSIQDVNRSDKITNFIFFDKISAIKFCNSQGRKLARFPGSNTPYLDFIIRKPKIFVHNLEDFLELWEEALIKKNHKNQDTNSNNSEMVTIFATKATYFVPPKDINEHKKDPLNSIKVFFVFKIQSLTGWTERFLNTN
jgi:hypothetical protein